MRHLKLSKAAILTLGLTLLLGSALFVFAANIQFIEGGPHSDVDERTSDMDDWANVNKSCYFSMYAERADGGGDLSVTGYREPRERDPDDNSVISVRYRAYAQATAWGGWQGRANAWVNLTPRDGGIVHDQGGPGADDVDGDGNPWFMSASDSHIRLAHGVGLRRITAGASLVRRGGGGRVTIKVVLTGI